MRPGDALDVLHIPANTPMETAEHVKRTWRNETGRECLVLSGATYGGTVSYEVVDADVIDGFTAHDMAQAYEDGVQDSMLRATQIERVLTDLIAELREGHPAHGDRPPLWARDAAGRAEARLRELDTPTEDGNERIN